MTMIRSVQLHGNVSLPYVEQGDASGVPLLLLHGFAGSWRSFELVMAHLPESIHVLAPTQRGHGEASKPREGYRVQDLAGDVAAFLDRVGVEAAVIAGHSMGSAIALRYAVEHPERILGLVLAGACVPQAGGEKVRAFWESTVSTLTEPIDPAFVRKFLESTLAQPVPEASFERMLEDSLKLPARVWKAAWKRRLQDDPSVELDKIEAPTLIVWGDQDRRCPRREQEALETGIAGARWVVYAGAGHGLPVEAPERFAADLAAFAHDVASA
jgi:pimeloyl-ACP methyl ester carboxylesterase